MTAPDPLLTAHYEATVRYIERVVLASIPRFPFLAHPSRVLDDRAVTRIAGMFVEGHRLAAGQEVAK